MDYFEYKDRRLFAEQVALSDIAEQVGTPCFVYSRATLERHWKAFNSAFGDYPHQICYAVKANGNLAILNLLARLGSGFDVVSAGELMRVIEAGGDPAQTIFSGVCKQNWEIRNALEAGVHCFNIESEGELQRISAIAGESGARPRISVRINPDVDAKTHPYISTGLRENKFGLSPDKALEIYKQAAQDNNIQIHGVACHIGSQLTELSPFKDALNRALYFVDQLERIGIEISQLDFGGGLGVRYRDEHPPSADEYGQMLLDQLKPRTRQIPVVIEPGRAIVANAGILLTRVHYIKHGEASNFCIVDAGMNDLIRPALYQAYQDIVEVDKTGNAEPAIYAEPTIYAESTIYDVVGPVCESSDFLGKQRRLHVAEDDLLAVRTAGAYGAAMSSNYNSRPRPAEVMVDGDKFQVIKPRETLQSLYRGEQILP
ncbi:diaminopimelate decarboxylase [Candidatus Spongiihabitans sp.]|uniref:diaminopimelate decarboxylase n=1 Tax=Candidatus Spongiihabitans sp. TaxID=3101308 RepID=UPI003C7EAB76